MRAALERFRRPEFTGENRCWPCTVANGGVLVALVAILAVVGRRTAAAVLAVVGVVVIALRGYLVPYAPRFAPRVGAAVPGDHFTRRETEPGSLADAEEPSGEEVAAALLESGVVVLDGDEVYLDGSFRDAWRDEMVALRDADVDELAAVADAVTPPPVSARSRSGWRDDYVVLDRADGSPTSLPRAIAVAELAAARALAPVVEDERIRLSAGRPLRTMLASCPLCDGEATVTGAACCGEVTPIGSTPTEKLVCPDCDVRLYTYDD